MDCPDLDSGEWSAVNVGPLTVGWIGSHDFTLTKLADITAIMGGVMLPMDTLQCYSMGYSFPDEGLDNAFATNMLTYNRRFVVSVPAGSINMTEGAINYSKQTMEILHTILSNFFTPCVDRIQAEFHLLSTPVEVVRKYAELSHYYYPKALRDALTWRGKPLDEVSRGTKTRVRTVRMGAFDYGHHSVSWNLANESPLGAFNSLVKHHIRPQYDDQRILPENVFIIKTSSDEEYEIGKTLLAGEEIATEQYLLSNHPNIQDASFFLCPTGDPLEGWIDGEVLSLEEFAKPMRNWQTYLDSGQYSKELNEWMT